MEPVDEFFLLVVHENILIVERKDDKVQKSAIEQTFGKHRKYDAGQQ
jgi:hypothetical protein